MRRDIDDALSGWPYDPQPGDLLVREIRARDGRMVLQVRIALGILQMEVEGRPDGTRPHGFSSYLDYMRYRAVHRGLVPDEKSPSWVMTPAHSSEADRELLQYEQRRLAWLALHRYEKALRDAEHSLAMIDFISRHGSDADYIASHQAIRGIILFHRTQAAAALALEHRKPEEALELVQDGIEQLGRFHEEWQERTEQELPEPEGLEQLRRLEQEIRSNFGVAQTLREQLADAVALEDYERAARLRDQINAKQRRR